MELCGESALLCPRHIWTELRQPVSWETVGDSCQRVAMCLNQLWIKAGRHRGQIEWGVQAAMEPLALRARERSLPAGISFRYMGGAYLRDSLQRCSLSLIKLENKSCLSLCFLLAQLVLSLLCARTRQSLASLYISNRKRTLCCGNKNARCLLWPRQIRSFPPTGSRGEPLVLTPNSWNKGLCPFLK